MSAASYFQCHDSMVLAQSVQNQNSSNLTLLSHRACKLSRRCLADYYADDSMVLAQSVQNQNSSNLTLLSHRAEYHHAR